MDLTIPNPKLAHLSFSCSRGSLARVGVAVVLFALVNVGCAVKKIAVNKLGNAIAAGGDSAMEKSYLMPSPMSPEPGIVASTPLMWLAISPGKSIDLIA